MQVISYRVVVRIILSVAVITVEGGLAAQQKTPLPAPAQLEAPQRAADELFGTRFPSAKSDADKTSLAAEMIEAALKVPDGSADQYVLLKIARDVAAGAGDAAMALQAVERLAEWIRRAGREVQGRHPPGRNTASRDSHGNLAWRSVGAADGRASDRTPVGVFFGNSGRSPTIEG